MTLQKDNGALPSYNEETNQVGTTHIQRVCLDLGDDGASSPVVGNVPVIITAMPDVAISNMSGLVPPATNYIAITYTDSTEEYIETLTCKSGGISGTILRTITYTYTASKNVASISYV